MGPSMSKAYAIMVMFGIEERMKEELFKHIHDMGEPPRNYQELRQIFIDADENSSSLLKLQFQKKFDAAFKGFAVDSMARRMDKQFENSGLTYIPAIVVNNKYVVDTQTIKSNEEYLELVNYLFTQK